MCNTGEAYRAWSIFAKMIAPWHLLESEHFPDSAYEQWLEAVKQDGSMLQYVPEDLATPEIWIVSVQQLAQSDPWVIQKAPDYCLTPETCKIAVDRCGDTLEFVPEALKTPDLCLAAVQQSGHALQFVPETLCTPEICLAAVRENRKAAAHVPEHCRLAMVQEQGSVLGAFSDSAKTPELCLAAVQQKGRALEYVPEDLKTAELCLAAVQQNGFALEFVPEALKAHEICLAAVRRNGQALHHLIRPRFEWLLCVWVFFPEGTKKFHSDEVHGVILVPIWD